MTSRNLSYLLFSLHHIQKRKGSYTKGAADEYTSWPHFQPIQTNFVKLSYKLPKPTANSLELIGIGLVGGINKRKCSRIPDSSHGHTEFRRRQPIFPLKGPKSVITKVVFLRWKFLLFSPCSWFNWKRISHRKLLAGFRRKKWNRSLTVQFGLERWFADDFS